MKMIAYEQLHDKIYVQDKKELNKRGRVKSRALLKPIKICRHLERKKKAFYCYIRVCRFPSHIVVSCVNEKANYSRVRNQ